MHYLRNLLLFLLLAFLINSKAQDDNTSLPVNKTTKQVVEYINQFKDIAIYEMLTNQIPASITLAQGILESQNGTSRLAVEAHNHFGIKCKNDWDGKVLLEDDDDFQECFRSYETAMQSYADHSKFLMSSPRYAFLFDYEITDFRSWAHGLKKAGYATNPLYAQLLIDLIIKYRLNQYDRYTMTPEGNVRDTSEKHTVAVSNGIPATKALKGDSYARIAIENKMKVAELLRINDLSEIRELHTGEVVYIKPKATTNKDYQTHIIRTGESMHDVSQQYGIKLNVLLMRNGLKPGEEPSQGETVTLNKKNKKKIKKRKDPNADGRQKVDMSIRIGARTRADSIVEAKYNTQIMLENNLDSSLSKIEADTAKEQKPYLGNIDTDDENPEEKPDEVSEGEIYHYVMRKETLYSIANLFKITVEDIMEWNNLKNDTIRIGQRLQVTNHNYSGHSKIKTYSMDNNGYYTVQEGDSFNTIAPHFSLTSRELVKINAMNPMDTLVPGMKLLVIKPEKLHVERPAYYVVKHGDTLFSIAHKFDITVAELKNLNSLYSDYVKEGMKLFLQ